MTRVGILGSASLVARSILNNRDPNLHFVPFSRADRDERGDAPIPHWISLIPIWALSDRRDLMETRGAKRIVALSSTSVFTKVDSSEVAERMLVEKLLQAERDLAEWAKARSIQVTILRPTLIYGYGQDRNVTQIAGIIRRFGCFPLFGPAQGLRQPIHVDDVALACLRSLEVAKSPAYNISGGECLTYREMVKRIFRALGKRPNFVTVPLWIFRAAAPCVRLLPKFHDWSPSMAERMNQDMAFDNSQAQAELGIIFRPFEPTLNDVTTKG